MVSLICTLQDHRDDVNWCAFSPRMLATCSVDKTVRVYSVPDFCELPFSPLSGHGYGVHACCFSSCGRYLASCSTDATTLVWSMETGEVLAALEHPGRVPVRVCAFSPDSSHLVSCASDGTIALWDFHSKTLRRTGGVSETTVVACSFTPCGRMFVTGSTYGDLRLWSLELNQLHAEKNAHDLGVSCCHFSSQAQSDSCSMNFRLASCGQDSQLKIWIVSWYGAAGPSSSNAAHNQEKAGCAFSKAAANGRCKVQLLHTLTGQVAPVLSCAFSCDGQLLVSGSVDKTVTVYDANQGVLLYTLNQHDRYVTACAFSPLLPLFATGSMDKTVNVWRLEDGTSIRGNDGKLSSVETPHPACEGGRLAGHTRLLVSDWSEADVSAWLQQEGLEPLVDIFKTNNIDGAELIGLSKETLATDLKIESVGLRNKVLKKIEELKVALVCTGIPDEFLCPVTREVMNDPVIAADGYSYERQAIESWISTKNRSSPMTNLPLQTTVVTPNRTLKMAISRWKATQS